MTRHFDFLIVGAGFAGASTAYHLTRRGERSVAIVEREKVPGYHASGRNASMLLQAIPDPVVRGAVMASRQAYEERAEEVGFAAVGSLLTGSRSALEARRDPGRLPSAFLDPETVREQIPLLAGASFDAALSTPSDGVMDISRLLTFYLDEARRGGAELLLGTAVTAVRGRGPFRVATEQGEIEAGRLVDASGCWASPVAELAGGEKLPLIPWKRHLFVLDVPGDTGIDPCWPFVWALEPEHYFRPESGGLLFSICDEGRSRSFEPTVEPGMEERLAELVWEALPALHGTEVRRCWSCFRTKSPDDRFVIGPDPELPELIWVAGLGGHGMGASWEVGRWGALAALGEPSLATFDPIRFATS